MTPDKLKMAALGLLAALATSASVSAGAQASGGGTFTVSTGTAHYLATQVGGGHTLTLPGNRRLSCSSATLTGWLDNNATTTIASPLYSGCIIEIGVGGEKLPTTVKVSSCQYDFTLTGASGAEWIADTKLVCGPGNDITLNVYANAEEHTKGVTLCEYTIAGNQELTGVTFRNLTGTTIGIKTSNASIAYTKTKGPIGTCGGSSGTAIYQGDTAASSFGVTLSLH